MFLKYEAFVLLLVFLCYHESMCKKTQTKRRQKTASQDEMAGVNQQNSQENTSSGETEEHRLGNAPIPSVHNDPQAFTKIVHTATEEPRHEHKHKLHTLEHKIENAPLPCVHEGPQPLKIHPRSAPMALDNKYKDLSVEQQDQTNNPGSPDENSPNPQRPNGWKVTTSDSKDKTGEGDLPAGGKSHFYHPGHGQVSDNQPTDSYNYYGFTGNYGGAYKYNEQQSFKGYYPTSNIGVIPPKHENARDYYNKISGLSNKPVIAQQSGLFAQLFGNNGNIKFSSIRYGMGGFGFDNNAYKNVLAGLVLWNLMNGFATLRYNVYYFYNFPEWIRHDLSLSYESITTCPENASAICTNNTQLLCTNEHAIFCVSTNVTSCPNHENTCVETMLPCHDTKSVCNNNVTVSLPCIANFTLSGDGKTQNTCLKPEMLDKTLCVTTMAIPHIDIHPCNEKSNSGDETDCNMKSAVDNGIVSTTATRN